MNLVDQTLLVKARSREQFHFVTFFVRHFKDRAILAKFEAFEEVGLVTNVVPESARAALLCASIGLPSEFGALAVSCIGVTRGCDQSELVLCQRAGFVRHNVLHLAKIFNQIEGVHFGVVDSTHILVNVGHFGVGNDESRIEDSVELETDGQVERDEVVEKEVEADHRLERGLS